MKVKIIGYERNAGFSKKKNANYDYHILHTQSCKPLNKPGCYGSEVATIVIREEDGVIVDIPKPGEIWEMSYDRAGRIEAAYKCKE